MSKTFVIAEAGSSWRFSSCHLANALKAVEVAKAAGCDAVKFQWCSTPRLMEKRRHVKRGSYDILCWPQDWMIAIKAICEQVGIELTITVFIERDIATIAPFVSRFKVASLEAMDRKLVQACCAYRRQVIVSAGALSHDSTDVEGIWPYLEYEQVAWLQCTAAYPCPPEALNLATIAEEGFAGLSDHSGNVLAGALAVACGAQIIEVHFRLSRTPKDNPDFNHSHGPERLKQYVSNIRKAEVMLGDGVKRVMDCEMKMLKHRVVT